ncbi:MAG: heme-binding protein [Dehalococcoidia bacterium]
MYDRPNLGLDEAMRGLLAALEEAKKDEAEGRPVVIAIVDHKGDLVCFARQDGCLEMSKEMAIRKAFTAAIGRRDSADYAAYIEQAMGRSIEVAIGLRVTSGRGGVVIKRSADGVCLGGIGVSGAANAPRDEEVARAGVAAMGA